MFEIKRDNIKYNNKVYDIKDTLIGDCFIIYVTKKRKIKFIKSESNMTENIIALPQYKYIFESYFQNTCMIKIKQYFPDYTLFGIFSDKQYIGQELLNMIDIYNTLNSLNSIN